MLLTERRTVLALSAVFACRMLGLFIVLPVLSLYAERLPGASVTSVGLLAGVYGLTQALFQIPFGFLSDRFGRKPMIILGLIIFMVGSLVAADAEDITTLVFGRALQGAGAVGSVVLALLADLTREAIRPKAMAIVGATIGASFAVAMILGPWLDAKFGLSALFELTAGLALVANILIIGWVPSPAPTKSRVDAASWRSLLTNRALWQLNLGVCTVHALLTACFLFLPTQLLVVTGWPPKRLWKVYLLVLACAFMLVWRLLSRRRLNQTRNWRLAALVLWGGMLITAMGSEYHWLTFAGMLLFFAALNWLEAALPAQIANVVPSHLRGTALGVYSSLQFFGIFLGGALGGLLLDDFGLWGLVAGCTVLASIWWISLMPTASLTPKPPNSNSI